MEKFSQLVTWVDGKVWGLGDDSVASPELIFHDRPKPGLSEENNHKRNQAFRIQRTGCRR